jgi:hypothetical protein
VKATRWTYLRPSEIIRHINEAGIEVSHKVVKRLLHKAGLGQRQMAKKASFKENVPGRDEQFKLINTCRSAYLSQNYPVLSIDVKKKELLGKFFRKGQVISNQSIECYTHDFPSYSDGTVVPYGVYDVGKNQGYMILGQSADTAQFNVACLRLYWEIFGSKIYTSNEPILLLLDGGGSNASSNRLFKQELQDWADEIQRVIQVAHYPAYCSKYNPIEHRLFPFITKAWQGVMLDNIQTMKQLIEQRTQNTKSGIKIFVEKIEQVFEKGVTVLDNYLDDCNIVFGEINKKLNYHVIPI